MDNAMMIGLARQMTLRRAMDIAANNIANASTTGFKAEHELLAEMPMGRARDVDGRQQIRYVTNWGVLRDFRTGPLEQTGRDLDLAIQGRGFFQLEAGENVQYTRDGRFSVNADGTLVAADGAPVLDAGGAQIVLPPDVRVLTVTPAGAVMADGAEIARLAVVDFPALAPLRKVGDGRLTAPEGTAPEPVEFPDVRQGFFEGSNVNPVLELTRMLEITRTYQSVSKMLEQNAELSRTAIDRLGRAQR